MSAPLRCKPYCVLRKPTGTSARSSGGVFTPLELAQLYGFPTGANTDGTGQKVGIIELGGGYVLSDIQTYFGQLGISGTPNLVDVSVDGAFNDPTDTSGANVEVLLDTEIIAAIVPRAQIRIYFAPNSDTGFYNAIARAKTDGCNAISISWGAPEAYWTSSSMNRFNNLFSDCASAGILVTAASGDNGSSDGLAGQNCDFPASSPFVLACGGTRLVASNATTISSETVWNNNTGATGGGVSKQFAKPSYQVNLSVAKRGVPDVCGDADPNTGYICYGEGSSFVVGGTSAVSPLWAALIARVNQVTGLSVNTNQLHAAIYRNPSCCRDITSGNNGAFSAAPAWDACTGFGSPAAASVMLPILQGTQPQPTPSPVPAPVPKFSASPTAGTGTTTVTFSNQSTGAVSYAWQFGDGGTSSVATPTHAYAPGRYNVTLTVTNSVSVSVSTTKTGFIVIKPPAPVASFTATPVNGTGSRVAVQFRNASTNAVSYQWNFGDGGSSTAASPTHTYTPGLYSVKLSVRSASGVAASQQRNNYIRIQFSAATKPRMFTRTKKVGMRPLRQ